MHQKPSGGKRNSKKSPQNTPKNAEKELNFFACPFWPFGKSYAYYEKAIHPYRTIGPHGRRAGRLQSVVRQYDDSFNQRGSRGSRHQRASSQVGHFFQTIWECHSGRAWVLPGSFVGDPQFLPLCFQMASA
jgi:hypothetical protein